MYNILNDIPAIRTLEVSQKSLPDCLILKDAGISLMPWSQKLRFSSAGSPPFPNIRKRFIV